MKIENLSILKIHKLTQEQYDREREAGRLEENAMYLTPDNSDGTLVTTDMLNAAIAEAITGAIGGSY